MRKRIDWNEALRLVRACRDPLYCCLHIVLEDGNLEDGSVDFCIAAAKADIGHTRYYGLERSGDKTVHEDCLALAEFLRPLSYTQRSKIYKRIHELMTIK
jgi:hypothetical protein